MANLRNLGYKVRSLLNSNPAKKDVLRERLNFSENDLTRLEFGRLSLTPAQIKTTASVFSIEPKELVNYKNSDSYKDMIHCMSSFSSQEHCNEILDIIDSYIDIKEAAN